MLQSLEATFELDRMACMLRSDVQEDKRRALLDAAALMQAAQVPFVITGGLAVQRYVREPRFTLDVDLIVAPETEDLIHATLTRAPFASLFRLVHRKKGWTALVHQPSGTPVDINTSRLFRTLLEDPQVVTLEGVWLPFACELQLGWAKLRTQQPRWPRDPRKRLQDRADLMGLLTDNPDLYERLRERAEPALRPLLDQILAESAGGDDLPPDEDAFSE